MKFQTITRSLQALAVGALMILGAQDAKASILTYNFDVASDEFLQHLDAATTAEGRYYQGGGTAQVTYNTVTQALNLVVNTTGIIYGENADGSINTGSVLKSNVTGSLNINYTKGIQTNDPYANGLVTRTADGTTSSGTVTISDIALSNTPTSITYGVEAGAMDFGDPQWAAVIAGWPYYLEHKALNDEHGALTYYQYESPSLGLLVFSTWLHNVGHVGTASYCFLGSGGDLHGTSPVPEPATMGLLGLGLLGGAVRRKRAQA